MARQGLYRHHGSRSLKLYGMAHAIEDLVAQGAPAFEAATPMLSQLLKAEIAEREVRSIAYHTKVAVRHENSPPDCFFSALPQHTRT
ncbi:methylthioribose-1-phosphate isomerase [Sagittula marina]|uniref:Methylthioribose-1-phosphate isomerase n=1 Tax=Sagittula marina TaxID=943940 RepID=A0A7W6DXL8_9RHOB|nr:methylthioribose-1-phosphate isomerase [Sagittula marina]